MARKKKSQSPGAPLWMVTYSDMVTLLLTFFVLLLSMAQMDKVKFREAAGSLKGAFGLMSSMDRTQVEQPKIVRFAPIEDDYTHRLYRRLQAEVMQLKIDKEITLVRDRGAVVLRVQDAILFESGQWRLKPEAAPVLRKIAGLVRPLPLHLRIEGHTDDVPTARDDFNNWDLSVNRAVSVLKFLVGEKLVPLDRMSAVGYGAERPLEGEAGAETPGNNRRVEFVLESIGGDREGLPYLMDARDQLPF